MEDFFEAAACVTGMHEEDAPGEVSTQDHPIALEASTAPAEDVFPAPSDTIGYSSGDEMSSSACTSRGESLSSVASTPNRPSNKPPPLDSPSPHDEEVQQSPAPADDPFADTQTPLPVRLQLQLESPAEGRPLQAPSPAVPQAGGVVSQLTSWIRCLWKRDLGKKGQNTADGRDISLSEVQELEWLGSGAHGCVFLGTFRGSKVAVKKLKDRSMVEAEAATLASLDHENIVGFLGQCRREPVMCLLLEYCPQSLYDVVHQNDVIPPKLCLMWATQLASGIKYLHDKDIVHRDLKSPNILLAQDNRTLKITDFGSSRRLEGGKAAPTSFNGTVAWMSPEAIRSEPSGKGVDVWSFGVLLWELVTGEVPYKGVDAGAVVWGVGSNQLHLPVPESCPEAFALLLKICWSQKPNHRPCFRQILTHLEILGEDPSFHMPIETYRTCQCQWREEIKATFEQMKMELHKEEAELIARRKEELRHAEDVRHLYQRQLADTTRLYHDLVALESDLRARERLLDAREQVSPRRRQRKPADRRKQASARVRRTTPPKMAIFAAGRQLARQDSAELKVVVER